jgi:hypothetical protein
MVGIEFDLGIQKASLLHDFCTRKWTLEICSTNKEDGWVI